MDRRVIERGCGDDQFRAMLRDARERDRREGRLRAEIERLEAVVRSLRAAIDEEQQAEADTHGTAQEGQP